MNAKSRAVLRMVGVPGPESIEYTEQPVYAPRTRTGGFDPGARERPAVKPNPAADHAALLIELAQRRRLGDGTFRFGTRF